jgi:hypothetical protein
MKCCLANASRSSDIYISQRPLFYGYLRATYTVLVVKLSSLFHFNAYRWVSFSKMHQSASSCLRPILPVLDVLFCQFPMTSRSFQLPLFIKGPPRELH